MFNHQPPTPVLSHCVQALDLRSRREGRLIGRGEGPLSGLVFGLLVLSIPTNMSILKGSVVAVI